MNVRLALLAPVLALVSCVSTTTVRLGENDYEELPKNVSMPVYEEIDDIPMHAEKIGIVLARADQAVSWERMIRNLKREARRAGANALVLSHSRDREGILDFRQSIFTIPFTVQRVSALAVRVHDVPKVSSALAVTASD